MDTCSAASIIGRKHLQKSRAVSQSRYHKTLSVVGYVLIGVLAIFLSGCGVVWGNVVYQQQGTNCALIHGQLSSKWVGSSFFNISNYLTLDGSGTIANGSSVLAMVGSSAVGYGTGLTYVMGQVAQGVSFNGTTDYIDIPGTSAFVTANTSFSFSLWFNLSSTSTGILLAKGAAVGGANSKGFFIDDSAGQIVLFLRDNSGTGTTTLQTATASTNLHDSKWHYLVMVITTDTTVYTNNTAVIYLDGVLNQNTPVYPSSNPYAESTLSDLSLGARTVPASPNAFFNGSLDEVAFWTTALTATQVQALYNCQAAY